MIGRLLLMAWPVAILALPPLIQWWAVPILILWPVVALLVESEWP